MPAFTEDVLVAFDVILTQTEACISLARLSGTVGPDTALIHVAFATAGHEEFHQPLSIAVLAACLFAGMRLLLSTRKASIGP
ncbi:DUF6713 family protein [Stenotrophomonas pavanii]|uniref:DUF6713 family protein n=1 Tax=Stenotrophomonas pavanii TaxID=487698 RepID=UPI0039C71EBB